MNIALFNVKFSPNLGDGLLSECLEAELRNVSQDVTVQSLDLAGRRRYAPGSKTRRLQLIILQFLPIPIRRIVTGAALRRVSRRVRPVWSDVLAQSHAVIVGGGNLFADADLNFPIKIETALAEAARRDLPVAVFGVGVSTGWSRRGRQLFQLGLTGVRLVDVKVRDERSQAAWNGQLDSNVMRAQMTTDPGLLAADHFPRPERGSSTMRVGLGITDPVALRYHGGEASSSTMVRWLRALVAALATQKCEIFLFTNGSPEDQAFLSDIAPDLIAAGDARVHIAPAFGKPCHLAEFLATCDVVLAHRMHACIAAYSYRVPTIGFQWDVKLQSFFELTGREMYIVDAPNAAADVVAELAWRAVREGIDVDTHTALLERCRRDISNLVELFRADQSRAAA